MKCEDIQRLLDLHMDGELPVELQTAIDRHVLHCSTCAFEFHSLVQTRSLLSNAVDPEAPSAGFRERTAARLNDIAGVNPHAPQLGGQWMLPFALDGSDPSP